MMAILTGSASAVPAAKHPAPASASAAQNFLIAPSPFDRPTLCTPLREGGLGAPLPARASDRPRAGSIMLRGVAHRQGGDREAGRVGISDAGLLGSTHSPLREAGATWATRSP